MILRVGLSILSIPLLAHKENLVVVYSSIAACVTVRCSSPAANLGFPKTKDPTNYNPDEYISDFSFTLPTDAKHCCLNKNVWLSFIIYTNFATVGCFPAANLGFPKTKDPTNYNPDVTSVISL